MYRFAPNIYEMLDTLSLEMKEELLEYLKADIAAAKAAPKKSYLEEQWAEIKRLIEKLKYEPYIDDQFEIEEIWDICEEMIKSGKLKKEPWPVRRRVLKSIIGGEYYDYYGVYDPMKDLFKALMFTPEEKTETADIMFEIGSGYMQADGAKLYKECGQQEKYITYVKAHLKDKEEPYLEVIDYYKEKDPEKIVNQEFSIDFQGYNPEQVDTMLDNVIKDYQTYDKMISDLKEKIGDLERTNASLRAKLIEVEGKAKAQADADPMQLGASQIDILKRLSRLEKQVFDSKNRK